MAYTPHLVRLLDLIVPCGLIRWHVWAGKAGPSRRSTTLASSGALVQCQSGTARGSARSIAVGNRQRSRSRVLGGDGDADGPMEDSAAFSSFIEKFLDRVAFFAVG